VNKPFTVVNGSTKLTGSNTFRELTPLPKEVGAPRDITCTSSRSPYST